VVAVSFRVADFDHCLPTRRRPCVPQPTLALRPCRQPERCVSIRDAGQGATTLATILPWRVPTTPIVPAAPGLSFPDLFSVRRLRIGTFEAREQGSPASGAIQPELLASPPQLQRRHHLRLPAHAHTYVHSHVCGSRLLLPNAALGSEPRHGNRRTSGPHSGHGWDKRFGQVCLEREHVREGRGQTVLGRRGVRPAYEAGCATLVLGRASKARERAAAIATTATTATAIATKANPPVATKSSLVTPPAAAWTAAAKTVIAAAAAAHVRAADNAA